MNIVSLKSRHLGLPNGHKFDPIFEFEISEIQMFDVGTIILNPRISLE